MQQNLEAIKIVPFDGLRDSDLIAFTLDKLRNAIKFQTIAHANKAVFIKQFKLQFMNNYLFGAEDFINILIQCFD